MVVVARTVGQSFLSSRQRASRLVARRDGRVNAVGVTRPGRGQGESMMTVATSETVEPPTSPTTMFTVLEVPARPTA